MEHRAPELWLVVDRVDPQTITVLQVGALLMGWSFQLSDHVTINNSFQFGVTSDAPDLQIVFRVPYRF